MSNAQVGIRGSRSYRLLVLLPLGTNEALAELEVFLA